MTMAMYFKNKGGTFLRGVPLVDGHVPWSGLVLFTGGAGSHDRVPTRYWRRIGRRVLSWGRRVYRRMTGGVQGGSQVLEMMRVVSEDGHTLRRMFKGRVVQILGGYHGETARAVEKSPPRYEGGGG